ncbi:MAG: Flp family type IVb pilin [Nitriliruptorales bacterium]
MFRQLIEMVGVHAGYKGTALERLHREEDGVTATEYGLIAALVAVAIIAGATLLGDSLNSLFSNISGTVDANNP